MDNRKPFTDDEKKEFEEACKPLVDWRRKNLCPHDTIIIDAVSAEVLSGMMAFHHFKEKD